MQQTSISLSVQGDARDRYSTYTYSIYEKKYSTMDQVKFVEDSL